MAFNKNDDSSIWMNVSDLFSVLFLVFLLLSLLFVMASMETLEELKKVEAEKQMVEDEIKQELKQEFQQKLDDWQAEFIDSTLSLRFYSDSEEGKILFQQGSSQLEPYFQNVLAEFFPSYLTILRKRNIKNRILDIRIEGHTSTEGEYLSNMFLSQQRSNSVLAFLLNEVPLTSSKKEWLLDLVSSNGLGPKRPIFYKNGDEDFDKSRRVEIKLVLKEVPSPL